MFRVAHSNQLAARLSGKLLQSLRLQSTATGASVAEQKIVLPKPIKREPTDILYALAATVKRDPTAPSFQFIDDPYLIPKSQMSKTQYTMAMESGRKAAYFVQKENPQLFQHMNADPPIKAYQPATVYDENSSVNVQDLDAAIERADVADAIIIYEVLQKNKEEISNELRQSLLELMAFYNSRHNPEDELNHAVVDVGSKTEIRAWTDGGFADELFDSMEPKTDAAYNAIIRGKSKYNQATKAYQLYKDALKEGVTLDAATFNHVILLAYWLHDSGDSRWKMVTDTLHTMNGHRVRPNIETLNAVLYVATKAGNYAQARKNCLQTLAEFHRLGVQPSLGSWYSVLSCFCRDRAPTSYVLHDILDHLENKEWQAQTPQDYSFFATAMSVCRNHLQDAQVADRIHRLLHFGNNYQLLGNAHRETVYYRNYLGVMLDTQPIDDFMRIYDTIVPNLHCPEQGVIIAILQSLDAFGAIEYLPKIWSDMIVLQHSHKSHLTSKILNIMAVNKPVAEIEKHNGLNERFATIAWDVHTSIENQPDYRQNKQEWSGQMLSDALIILCRANDFVKAEELFEKCQEPKVSSVAAASGEAIEQFVRLCIAKGKPTPAVNALKYNAENVGSEENVKLGQLIVSSLTLSETHLSRVASLIGAEHIKSAQEST